MQHVSCFIVYYLTKIANVYIGTLIVCYSVELWRKLAKNRAKRH